MINISEIANMTPDDFNFPQGKVAPKPCERGKCKMMVVDIERRTIKHDNIANISKYYNDEEVWANNSYNAELKDKEKHPLYAKYGGSHATPSAGIPLTEDLIKELEIKFLTLHIVSPSDREDIMNGYKTNKSWSEPYSIYHEPSQNIFAIGTTVAKAMEHYDKTKELSGEADLFIQPTFQFMRVKKLLTNFHFAKEPLLALTCAFAGYEMIREAYKEAVAKKYLFGDYGDRLLMI